MKKISITVFVLLMILSCGTDCKEVSGSFSSFSASMNYKVLSTYTFSGNSVSYSMTSKTGSQDYKTDSRQSGTFRVEENNVIMNFGGHDVSLNIIRSSNGCILSLSGTNGNYERNKQ